MKGYAGVVVPKRKQAKFVNEGRRLKRYVDELPSWDASFNNKAGYDAPNNNDLPQPMNTFKDNLKSPSEIPKFKDWYKEGAVTVPLDQAGCGGCWAFSTAAALESMAYISKIDNQLQNYSIQQLLDCDTANYGCDGGWMYEGFEYVSNNGILTTQEYGDFAQRKNTCHYDINLRQDGRLRDIGYLERDRKSNDELRALVAKQPVSIGFRMSPMLNSYSSGVATEEFLKCSNTNNEVNHGVLLVGYGSLDPGTYNSEGKCKDYWIIRNSWGRRFGEDGFFKLCADGVGSSETPLGTCLVNKYAVVPTLDKSDIEPESY